MTDKPVVIIGGGLTAMATSRSLSLAKINHVIVGSNEPNSLPRLGESMNPEGSTELINQFPDYSEFFHDKKLTIIGVGEHMVHCNFSQIGGLKRVKIFLNSLSPGLKIPRELIHIDRIGFDKKLYKEIKTYPYLSEIDSLVDSVEYDEKTDEIQTLVLKNGDKIKPRYVFDCTNHVRLLGRSLKIPIEFTSESQHVVYTHIHIGKNAPSTAWEASTNLLRLEKNRDKIDAFAWCIPLEEYISVGVSLEATELEHSNDEILELVRLAFNRRGLSYQEKFSEQKELMQSTGRYFTHKKAYGSNWVLSGPSYSQIWYMSGSGVGTSLSAAFMAPQLVKTPLKSGKVYQKYMDRFENTHRVIDWFVKVDLKTVTMKSFQKNILNWLMSNINRMSYFPIVREKKLTTYLSGICNKLLNLNLIPSSYFSFPTHCPVYHKPEGIGVWSSVQSGELEEKKQTLDTLLKIISGELPIHKVDEIMAPNVTLWMDSFPVKGRLFWKAWVSYLRAQAKFTSLKLVPENYEQNQGAMNIVARWHGKSANQDELSGDVIGKVVFAGNKIVDIKSQKSNYTFILGRDFDDNFVFFITFIKIFWCSLFNFKQLVLQYDDASN